MKVKYAYKENPGETNWYNFDGVKEIHLVLRSGAEATIMQEREGMLPKIAMTHKKNK